jgi:ATP-dependent DNA helicase DinG
MDVAAVYGRGGLLSEVMAARGRPFTENTAQVQFAETAVATIGRARDVDPPLVLAEAGTGVGKTLGYLIPSMIEAVKTGLPALISTMTIELQRQILLHDAPVAADVVERLGYRRPTVAVRLGRRNYVSVSRIRTFLEGFDDPRREHIQNLLVWAEESVRRANQKLATHRQTGNFAPYSEEDAQYDGVLANWVARLPDPDLLTDLGLEAEVNLLSVSPDTDMVVYDMGSLRAAKADVVLTSHAFTAIDLLYRGKISGVDTAYSSATIDEADRFADAAASGLASQTALSGVQKTIDLLWPNNATAMSDLTRNALVTIALDATEDLAALREEAETAMVVDYRNGTAPFGQQAGRLLRSLRDRLNQAAVAMAEDPVLVGRSDRVAEEVAELSVLLRSVDANDDAYYRLQWTWSPRLKRPSIVRRPAIAGRLAKRFWNDPEKMPRARAILFTSATLATPGQREEVRWQHMMMRTGVDPTAHGRDLWTTIEPGRFGRLEFVFAHPTAPVPTPDHVTGQFDPVVIKHLVATVKAAADEGGRVFVLTPAYADVAAYEQALHEVLGDRLLAHTVGKSLQDLLRDYRAREDAVLITPGAWEGVNLPGLIRHLVIARLPFPPRDNETIVRFEAKGERQKGEVIAFIDSASDMLRKLRQGIGRAIRKADDHATVWFADPRLPFPEEIGAKDLLLPHGASRSLYLSAIPRRFRTAFETARIMPPLEQDAVVNVRRKGGKRG